MQSGDVLLNFVMKREQKRNTLKYINVHRMHTNSAMKKIIKKKLESI